MSSIVSDAFRLTVREKVGGGASRDLRRSGMIPGELYGGGKENIHLSIDPRDVEKGLATAGFYSTIFELNINGKKERALVRDVQLHPVRDTPLHIDFMRVSKGATIHVNIPLKFENEAQCPGIKRGGILNILLHSLDVTCSVDHIPDEIVIDLEGLDMGHTIHTHDLKLPKGVTVTHAERDDTIATLIVPSSARSADNEAEAEATEAEKA